MENGLRVFLLRKPGLPIVNISVGFDVGSKDESEATSGLVHILEHCILFRGTESRTGEQVTQDIREHGAYVNAHTGFDLSLYQISLPAEHFEFALMNQRDTLFNFALTQKELDAEKAIILEELRQTADDPVRRAAGILMENLFRESPYRRPVSGNPQVISEASVEKIMAFHRQYYIPSRCAMAVVGDIEIEEAEKKIRAVFESIESASRKNPAPFSPARCPASDIEIEESMDVNQAYMLIGVLGPAFDHPDQYAVDVLTEILGHGINPMLNQPLRGRLDLVHSVRISAQTLKYGGGIFITLTLDPKNVAAAKRELFRFFNDLRKINFSADDYPGEERLYAFDYLESARNQIRFKSRLSNEKGLNIASSMAMTLILSSDPFKLDYMENIEKITSGDLREAAVRYLGGASSHVVVTVLPLEKDSP